MFRKHFGSDIQKYEIILIDDGSTDDSLKICKEFAKGDSRIIILQETHQGGVTSRRVGVEKAHGEYCIFVDSDDWIKKNLLQSIIPLTDNGSVDIVNYNMKSVKGSIYRDWRYTIPEGIYEKEKLDEVYRIMMFDFENGCPGIIQSLCTKLIKRDILYLSTQTVDKRITMGEDAAVVYNAMLMAKKIVITNDFFYFYRENPKSLCHKKDMEIFSRIYYFQKYMQTVFCDYDEKYELTHTSHTEMC